MVPILSIALFAPLIGALVIMAIPSGNVNGFRRVGIAFALVVVALAVAIWVIVAQANTSDQVPYPEDQYDWIPKFNVRYHLRADGLNAPLVFLTALVTLLALLYSARTVETRVKEYFALFLLLETSLFGVFLAHDLVLFYVFWVMGLLPMLLLIAVWGGAERESAAIKSFLYNLLGSAAMLIAILYMYPLVESFNISDAAAGPLNHYDHSGTARAVFWPLFAAFAIRMSTFPFHTWMPDAQTEAPTPVSAVLAGAFLSSGGYGLIRIVLPLLPRAFSYFVTDVWVLPVLAVMSIVYGALVCMAQSNLKRLIAYSSVVQMGFVLLGVCAAAVNHQADVDAARSGLSGAAMQIFAHGTIAGTLFLLAGVLRRRTQTYDLEAFGGFARQTPHLYGLTLAACLATMALPGLIGFWGGFFVFRSAVASATVVVVAAFFGALGLVFTAGCMLWRVVQHLFLGTLDEEKWGRLSDMMAWEKVTVWPLVLIMIVLGFYPTPVLDMLDAALRTLLNGLPRAL